MVNDQAQRRLLGHLFVRITVHEQCGRVISGDIRNRSGPLVQFVRAGTVDFIRLDIVKREEERMAFEVGAWNADFLGKTRVIG